MHWIDVRKILQDCGCVLEGDYFFALKSGGMVANKYINIDPLLTFPVYLKVIADMLMRDCKGFTVIAGPAVGAIPLVYSSAESVAHRFRNDEIRTVFAEKVEDGFCLKRLNFPEAVCGQNVVVVEDISSRGESARATADVVREAGGNVVGFRLIWNRNPKLVNEATMGAPVFSLIEEPVKSYKPEEHPMWGKWPLVSHIGHPEKFSNYKGGYTSQLS